MCYQVVQHESSNIRSAWYVEALCPPGLLLVTFLSFDFFCVLVLSSDEF